MPLEVDEAHVGQRLDVFLTDVREDLSRAAIQRLIDAGAVTIDGRRAKRSEHVVSGQIVDLRVPAPTPTGLAAEQEIAFEVVFENADLVVVDKPAGLVVHPAAGHASGTLVNGLLARYPDLAVGGSIRPGIVHRLDKDTSGLMVVARNDAAQRDLAGQIKARQVKKVYLALVWGHVSPAQATIDAPIGRDPRNRQKMAVVANGRDARTRYTLLERYKDRDLLEVFLETGRTHQIRVHLASVGHPVVGDSIYGRGDARLKRQFLHASVLGFRLPGSGDCVEFRSRLPAALRGYLRDLGSTALEDK